MNRSLFAFCLLLWLLWPASLPAAQERQGELFVISEVDVDPPGRDETGEWVELVYLGNEPLALEDYKVGDEEQLGSDGEGMFRFPEGTTAAPGQVIVIARNAPAFRARFGANPDFEFYDGDPAVPDVRLYRVWASGDLFLGNDGDELLLVGPDNVILDAVSWGDSQRFFVPGLPTPLPSQSLARSPASCDSDSAGDWSIQERPSPGTVELGGNCSAPVLPTPDVLPVELTGPIGAIQGEGAVSPYLDQVVTFRGIVTGLQEDRNMRGAIFYTLFVQDEPSQADGNPATADAIAVFTATARPNFLPGDSVQVRGRVSEFYGLTEIDFRDLEIIPLGRGGSLPPAARVSTVAPENLESLETMLVTLPEVRVAGPTHTGCGFAVAALDTPLPQLHEDPLAPPSPVLPVLHHSNVYCAGFPNVKRGDRVQGLTGPLTYQFDQFQLVQQDTEALRITPGDLPLPAAPNAPAPETFMVATVNLQDYFDDDPDLPVRREKLVRLMAIYLHCPALLALQEVETRELLQELADELREPCGTTYVVAHVDGPDERGIDVALLVDGERFQVTRVETHQGCVALETGIVDPAVDCAAGHAPLYGRPPLQVDIATGELALSVYVNHLKSKREGEQETAVWRLAQTTQLAALVRDRLESGLPGGVIVLGDFNDLPYSAPLQVLLAGAPLLDPLRHLPQESRYTYVFGGRAELLDTILLSPAAAGMLVERGILHMNTDYPAAWLRDATTPFHATDHDVPWVVLRVPDEATPQPTPAARAAFVTPTALPSVDINTPEPSASPASTNRPWMPVSALGAATILAVALRLRRTRGKSRPG